MRAGALDQRVTIERLMVTLDEYGGAVEAWAALQTVWAAVEPLNGREYFAANTIIAEVTTRIRMRYRADLTQVDRINHDGTLYNITSIINPRSGDSELVLMCRMAA